MKNIFFFTSFIFCISCSLFKKDIVNTPIEGEYVLKSNQKYKALTSMNYHSLTLNKDGTYTLTRSKAKHEPIFEECEYASKGKWRHLNENVLSLLSENYYLKQNGFKYNFKQEKKLSQDSLYIKINLPEEFIYYRGDDVVEFCTIINNKSIYSKELLIKKIKSKYLDDFYINNISFSFYKNGDYLKIFEENINAKEFNYISIDLPNFDLCFYGLEFLKEDILFINNNRELFWKGAYWLPKQ